MVCVLSFRFTVQEHKELVMQSAISDVRKAIEYLYQSYPVRLKIKFSVSPKQTCIVGAYADADYEAQSLILVPLSPTVSHGLKVPPNAVEVHLAGDQADWFKPERFWISPKAELPLGKKGETPFLVPFWAVSKAKDSAFVNMGFKNITVELTSKTEGLDSLSISAQVPVLTNTKPLFQGDALLKPDVVLFPAQAPHAD